MHPSLPMHREEHITGNDERWIKLATYRAKTQMEIWRVVLAMRSLQLENSSASGVHVIT